MRINHAIKKPPKKIPVYKNFMDESLVLLQKDNEETEKLLKAGQPLIHDLKMKLIEANNTIARYKALLEQKK